NRLAIFIDHDASDDAAAGQAKIDAFDELAAANFDRLPRVERTTLTEGHVDVAAFRRADHETAVRQLLEFVRPVSLGPGNPVLSRRSTRAHIHGDNRTCARRSG